MRSWLLIEVVNQWGIDQTFPIEQALVKVVVKAFV